MKLLKKRSVWISAAAGMLFAAAIYPYNHDMYVAVTFTYVCAVINLFSAVVFSVLLYFLIERKFPWECLGSVVLSLAVQIPAHMLFAAINWGSWVCLGLIAAYLLYCWQGWRRRHPLSKEQKKHRIIVLLVLVVLGSCVFGYYSSPCLRVRLFLMQYQDMLEARIDAANGDVGEVEAKFFSDPMPVLCGIKKFDVWPDDHDMVEFHLFGTMNVQYGCYYSFDDVPLPFQNAPLSLSRESESEWTWRDQWNNHGRTRKLSDHWYYFEAHF